MALKLRGLIMTTVFALVAGGACAAATSSAVRWGPGPGASRKIREAPSSELQRRTGARPDEARTVYLLVAPGADAHGVALAAAQLGATIEAIRPDVRMVQAAITPTQLDAVSKLAGVAGWRIPGKPIVDCLGPVCTEGDAVLFADQARVDFGVTGAGVRVGVFSDGIAGFESSCAAGELPPSFCSAPLAHAFSARADRDIRAGNEGLAMMEIIADVAPGAELFFANAETDLERLNALDFFSSSGCRVIADDMSSTDGPRDGTYFLSQATAALVSDGTVYCKSAGNYAQEHYRSLYVPDSGVIDAHHLFAPADDALNILVPVGAPLYIVLSWDDPYRASSNDYDLVLLDAGLGVVDTSQGLQDGDDDPKEEIQYTNPGPGTSFHVGIVGYNYPQPRLLDLIVHRGAVLEYATPGYEILSPSDAPGVLAVATVDAADPSVVTTYSSRGPTHDNRVKPEITGVAGVSTSVPGFETFLGTSAAAPHLAGVAALLLELDPSLTPGDITSILRDSAFDLLPAGVDLAAGAGLADAYGALDLATWFRPDEISGDGAPPFLVLKTARPDTLTIAWEDQDAFVEGYNLYAGRLSQLHAPPDSPWPFTEARYDHGSLVICDIGATTAQAPWLLTNIGTPPGGSTYFLIGAFANGQSGPTGSRSDGVEQDAGQATCPPR